MRKRAHRSLARVDSSSPITRARGARWPWLVGAVAVGAFKAEGYASLTHHRAGLIVVLAIGLALSVLRPKPVAIAAFAAALLAFGLAPHPLGLGVALGFGAFAVLMVLFFAISTALHLRQRRAGRPEPA